MEENRVGGFPSLHSRHIGLLALTVHIWGQHSSLSIEKKLRKGRFFNQNRLCNFHVSLTVDFIYDCFAGFYIKRKKLRVPAVLEIGIDNLEKRGRGVRSFLPTTFYVLVLCSMDLLSKDLSRGNVLFMLCQSFPAFISFCFQVCCYLHEWKESCCCTTFSLCDASSEL